MIAKNDSNENDNILDRDLIPEYVKSEEIVEKKAKTDYSKVYELPTIRTRYTSILIDGICLFLIALGVSALFEKIGEVSGLVRGITFVIVIVLYEPILVTIGCTIGQLIMNIRIRDFKNPESKLAFHLVMIRFILKAMLGWLSFITVTFNINRRAIHDLASGSIMIANKLESV
jgi:Predicted membrane protein/domain